MEVSSEGWFDCDRAHSAAKNAAGNSFCCTQIYRDYTYDPLLFSVAQGVFLLSSERLSRSTLHLLEGGDGSLYSCTLQTCNRVLSCIDLSVRIVTKSPNVRSLFVFSISLVVLKHLHDQLHHHTALIPSPLPLRVVKTGRNHLKEEFTPLLLTGIGERFQPNLNNLGNAAPLCRCELPL